VKGIYKERKERRKRGKNDILGNTMGADVLAGRG